MNIKHKKQDLGNWNKLNLIEQMANVGSEVERTISWKNKGNTKYSKLAFIRALELMDLTINCDKNRKRLKELTRVREALVDYFEYNNRFSSSDKLWQKYFFAFNDSARVNIG